MAARLCSVLALFASVTGTIAAQSGECLPSWVPTFGGSPGVDDIVKAQAVFDDGSGPALIVGGSFTKAAGVSARRIARWDGARWSALGSGLDGDVLALEVFDDGSGPALYAGGSFAQAGGTAAACVARWDGASWSTLGSGLTGFGSDTLVTCLQVFDDGSGPALYAAGQFRSAGGVEATNIARWDGAVWAPLGSGILGAGSRPRVSALAVFDDGSGPALFAGGDFNEAGGLATDRIARWDGMGWSPLGLGLSARARTLAVFDDGNGPALYAGGDFTQAGGLAASRMARWDGVSWSALGSGTNQTVLTLTVFDDGSGPGLYAGGFFTQAGGLAVGNVARWDGAGWAGLENGPQSTVYSLEVFDDGSGAGPALAAGGWFGSLGNQRVDNLALWDGVRWTPAGRGPNATVYALATFDDGSGTALYAGGSFTHLGREPLAFVGRWDGTGWTPLGSGVNGSVRALAVFDDGHGAALYVGGSFTSAGGNPASGIARWDGAAWSPLGSGLSSASVETLEVFDDGGGPALYVGGGFTQAGGLPASRIARWDGASWSSLGSGAGNGVNNRVLDLAVFDGGNGPALHAGGAFSSAGGAATFHIARWDGTGWSPLGGGLPNVVSALEVFDDGGGPALYAGGFFASAGGVPANGIARWDGAGWSALGNGAGGGVECLLVFDDGSGAGPSLAAGGSLLDMGGVPANHLACWDGTSWAALGNGVDASVLALAAFDDGSGPALFAGGDFLRVPDSGDGHLARWQRPRDTTPPLLECPTALHVAEALTGSAGETVFFSVVASDGCDPSPALVCVPPSGSFFPRGTTTVTCTATDSAGNVSSCSFPVTVRPKTRRR